MTSRTSTGILSHVGLYLIGTIIFRSASRIPQFTYRSVAAFLAVLTGFIGNQLYAGLQFICLIVTLVVLVLAESHLAVAKRAE